MTRGAAISTVADQASARFPERTTEQLGQALRLAVTGISTADRANSLEPGDRLSLALQEAEPPEPTVEIRALVGLVDVRGVSKIRTVRVEMRWEQTMRETMGAIGEVVGGWLGDSPGTRVTFVKITPPMIFGR
jgi:hypothetical protein